MDRKINLLTSLMINIFIIICGVIYSLYEKNHYFHLESIKSEKNAEIETYNLDIYGNQFQIHINNRQLEQLHFNKYTENTYATFDIIYSKDLQLIWANSTDKNKFSASSYNDNDGFLSYRLESYGDKYFQYDIKNKQILVVNKKNMNNVIARELINKLK